MDLYDKITLKAFLVALMRQKDSLPNDFQKQVNDIGKDFPENIFRLDDLTEDYTDFEEEYQEARIVLQSDGERFRSASSVETNDLVDINDEKLMNLASDILNAEDSVSFVKNAYAESFELKLLLSQLPSGEGVYFVELNEQGDSNPQKTSSALQAQESAYKINIFDLVGEYCMTIGDGQTVYDLIYPRLLADQPVELDFAGVEICDPPFLNFAVGQLLRDIPEEKLDSLLTVSHISILGEETYREVIDSSKEYYSDPEFRSKVDEIKSELANNF